ncbi:hypothetical protein [Burkholderia lata]|uniref:hypothetical protein n=1 Tax=Burkholderia lata (strain ATCC 17760 / DSM 23089 / LMG 22485 / NCIMB 9086 / R18194 / 383) TaxID=482957 RepID=UPI000B1883D1|nr:hypothetical protein [Burkholderia lata]
MPHFILYRPIMKKSFAALLLCASLPAFAKVSTEVYCFKSDGDASEQTGCRW